MDLFDLVAKITLDSSEYEKGMKEAGGGVASFSSGWAKAGKVAVAAIGAATVAVGALTKSAVESYAEYEQLAGGVKKLYGDAADELMRYAEQGYKTAGMSSNKYMELATSFSAALINSLDGDTSKAAKQTDVAMRAIADNFNTFGGDISNIQNAFQGFAKQNYTMLDNLKLGYGGTKSEMSRLIDDANEYAKSIGMAGDLSIDSFSDIVTAIDLVQQKQGIAGTTAKEAATTIEGSLNMTKAAWENLVAGFANPNADLGKLMDNLVTAIVGENEGEGLLNQILPAIERALEGIGQLVERAAPILTKHFPKLVKTTLPSLIKAATTLVSGLVTALPTLIQVLVAQMPVIINSLVTALTQALPLLAKAAPKIIQTLVDGIAQSLPTLIPAMVDAILTMVGALLDNIDLLVDAAIQLIGGLAEGLIKALPILIQKVPMIISKLVTGLLGGVGQMLSTGFKLISEFARGLWDAFKDVPGRVMSWMGKIPQAIKKGVGNLWRIGADIINGLWDGIEAAFDRMLNWIKRAIRSIPNAFKKILGIASPSKVFKELGKWIPEGLAIGIEDNMGVVRDASDAMADATTFVPEEQEFSISGTGNGGYGVEINVYATPQQDERQIAEMVQRQFVMWEKQRRMAYV